MLLYPPISSLNARPISIYSCPNQIPNPDTGKTKHLNISWRTESVLQIPNFGAQKYLSKIPGNQPPKVPILMSIGQKWYSPPLVSQYLKCPSLDYERKCEERGCWSNFWDFQSWSGGKKWQKLSMFSLLSGGFSSWNIHPHLCFAQFKSWGKRQSRCQNGKVISDTLHRPLDYIRH